MTEKVVAFDGWDNLFKGKGAEGTDRRLATTFSSRSLLQEGELSQLYADNGFAARIIDKHVEAMLQNGFKVTGDEQDQVLARFDELNAWKELERVLRWNRLHGGALIFLGVDDGQAPDRPVNEKNVRQILFLRTYDRWQVTVNRPVDIYTDLQKPKYGQVKQYNIQPLDGSSSFVAHESRCLVLDGVDVPMRVRMLNQYWGLSFLQKCFEQLRQLGEVYDDLESIISDFVTQTITMEGLMEKLAAGKESLIKRRLNLIDMSRSVYHTTLLDKEEMFEKKASTVTGLPECLDRYLQALSIVSGMPARILLGTQGGGLNNNGDGETRDWYDSVASEQVRIYKPQILERLVRLVMLEKQGKFGGKPPADWFIEFNPLYQMTDKEKAEIRKLNADTDCAYVQNQVLDPAEVAISRFGGPTYGTEIVLQTKDRNVEEEVEDDEDLPTKTL
jgi:uncharacterized protein